MRPLLTVFCWSGDNERIERHYPYWEVCDCDIMFSSPVDAPAARGGLHLDLSCHHGAPIMRRIFGTFEHVLKETDRTTFYFTEADSVGLRELPKALCDGLHCYRHLNDDPRFKAKAYTHYLQGFNRATLEKFVEAARPYNPGAEDGFQDRLIGLICEENNIEIIHRPDLCYSCNLIGDAEIPIVQRKMNAGIAFVHGVKFSGQLNIFQ